MCSSKFYDPVWDEESHLNGKLKAVFSTIWEKIAKSVWIIVLSFLAPTYGY